MLGRHVPFAEAGRHLDDRRADGRRSAGGQSESGWLPQRSLILSTTQIVNQHRAEADDGNANKGHHDKREQHKKCSHIFAPGHFILLKQKDRPKAVCDKHQLSLLASSNSYQKTIATSVPMSKAASSASVRIATRESPHS